MASREPDPVKRMISQAVQHHMVTGPNQPPLMEQPDNVESVEGSVISYLETQIRVVTRNQGVRYFNVKVSEPW